MHENRCSLQLKELFALALGSPARGRHARTQSGGGNDDNNLHRGERSLNAGSAPIKIEEPTNGGQNSSPDNYSGFGTSGIAVAGAGADTGAGAITGLRKSVRESMGRGVRSEEHTSELQSRFDLV